MRFHLFRIKVTMSRQLDVLDEQPGAAAAPEIIHAVLGEMPTLVTAQNHHWHIGQLENIEPSGLYFQLGRVTTTTEDQWDPEKMAFIESMHETARWTPVILDPNRQVAGIAPNRIIGRTLGSLGGRLRDLLNNTPRARDGRFRFDISELVDPNGFIQQVMAAYAVSRFSFTATKPNFPDSAELTRALENWIQDVRGEEGNAEVRGQSLDQSRIEEQTRETTARGGKVTARIQKTAHSSPKTIHGDKVPVTADGEYSTAKDRATTLRRIISTFREVFGPHEPNR